MSTGGIGWPAEFEIGGAWIGSGRPPFLIAEAGVNHNGDPARALEMVDAAADAGVPAIKFQTFRAAQLVSRSAGKGEYQRAATGDSGGQLEMLERLALDEEAFLAIRRRCEARGIIFLSTPFDVGSLDLLLQLGVPAIKLSSGDLTNLPFLRRVALVGKPVILSTGLSSLDEIRRAEGVCREAGSPALCLLQCVSAYPAPAATSNLRVMEMYGREFGLPVGFSDHTAGIHVAMAAVACGACVIEKHFTLDRSLPGPDHLASIEPAELREMQRCLGEVHAALGDGVKRVVAEEAGSLHVGRRSLHWSVSLKRGMPVAEEHLLALRPEGGVPPGEISEVIGRMLAADVEAGTAVRFEQLRARP